LWRASLCQSVLTFFGLTPDYKLVYMSEIHDLVFHGGGGFIWSEVYEMPIVTRRFHIRKINDFNEKQQEAYDKAQGKAQDFKSSPRPQVHQPDIVTKASKK